MMNKRLGISEVISTIIIISAMLLIAVTTLIIANNMFNYQSQNVEFEQAKNNMINLASIIEGISGKVGASGYVRFNTISGGPEYISNAGTVSLIVGNGTSNVTILQSSYDVIRYRGGSLVGVSGLQMLRGTLNGIILNNQYPLGAVYLMQQEGAYIVMNFSRINVVKMGVYNFTKGINITDYSVMYEAMNLIEIHYIRLRPGSFSGSGSINLVARTTNVTTTYQILNTSGQVYIYFNKSMQLINVDPDYNTVIIFIVSTVEIDMFGG